MRQAWSAAALSTVGIAALVVACGGGSGNTASPNAAATAPKADSKTQLQATAAAAGSPAGPSGAATQPAAGSGQSTAGSGKATGEPIRVGHLNDRSGPTANVGTKLGDAIQKWIEMENNTRGGVKGRPVQPVEVDIKYEVPLAVDAYKKFTTRDNTPQILGYGTPMVDAIAPSANQDKVVLWIPGIGLSESVDGKKYPYIFPAVATYKAQAAAVLSYIAEDWKAQGQTGNPKVVYSFYDNPAGRDPLDLIQKEGAGLGVDIIDAVPVPATTVDMTTIMTQIKNKNPDYLFTHYFGRVPALSLQAAEKVGLPRDRMISMVWGITQDEIEVAQAAAEKYRGIQFTALEGDRPEAYRMMDDYLKASGQNVEPKTLEHVQWARGMAMGALVMESARLADDPTKGESVKAGAEKFKSFTAYGLYSPTTITSEDHGGSRSVRMYAVEGGKLKQVKDWFEGPKTKSETGG